MKMIAFGLLCAFAGYGLAQFLMEIASQRAALDLRDALNENPELLVPITFRSEVN